MMRSRIGSTLDYALLATLNRPRDREGMAIAFRELAARGLGDYEIAAACGLAVEQVRRILAERASGDGGGLEARNGNPWGASEGRI